MAETKRVNTTVARIIKAYPPDRIVRLTNAYADYMGDSVSGVTSTALKEFFDKIPPQEKEKILTHYGRPTRQSKNGY